MNRLLSITFAIACCAPVFAQKMGSTNTNAPTLKQSIAIGDAKMSLNYTSITWADGKTMATLMDKERGARARTRLNETAKTAPLAEFSSSIDLMCGNTRIPAGEYTVGFTITDGMTWQLNFMKGDQVITMDLPMQESPERHKRLLMCLYAGDDEGCGAYVAFGNQATMLNMVPAKKS